jgi:hypothetical protein
MATDNSSGRQEANTEDFILMIKSTDLVKCIGTTAQFIKDFGQMEFKTDLV